MEKFKQVIKKSFYLFWKVSGRAFPPVSFSIEITDNCNLNCPMCPRTFAKSRGTDMSFEQFKTILEKIPLVKNILYLGRGETLISPDIYKMITLAKSKKIKQGIVTNGVLLTKTNIEKLDGVSVVCVSIDSPNPEVYKSIRGVNLEKILANIRLLKKLRPDTYVQLQAILMKKNISDIPNMVKMAARVRADEVSMIHLIAFSKDLLKDYVGDDPKLEYYNQKGKRLARKLGVRFVSRNSQPRQKGCLEPWYSARISLEGDVYSCCYIFESSGPTFKEYFLDSCLDVPQGKYVMGNIFKEDFPKIWQKEKFQLLRRRVEIANKQKSPTLEELNETRKKIDIKKNFSYCDVCLFRLSCAC